MFPAHFSLANTSPLDWKDGYLMAVGNELFILPKWLGRAVKQICNYFGFHHLSLDCIRSEFARQKELQLQKYTGISLKEHVKNSMQCNKNMSCLNEKIERVATHIPKLDLFVLPPIKKEMSERRAPPERLIGLNAPENGHEPNEHMLNTWVQEQHPSFQPVAYTVAQALRYVDFPAFVQALDESVQVIEERIQDRPFGIITWSRGSSSSGLWVASLLQLKRPHDGQIHIIADNNFAYNTTTKKSFKNGSQVIRDWILVDDAAYSGIQLNDMILPSVFDELTALYGDEKIQVHLAIPYMSRKAKMRFQDKRIGQCSFLPAPSRHMESLREIAEASLLEEDRQRGYSLIGTTTASAETCPTYFAHKIGDLLSFPSELASGQILSRTYKGMQKQELVSNITCKRSVRFLPQFTPHYRQFTKSALGQ